MEFTKEQIDFICSQMETCINTCTENIREYGPDDEINTNSYNSIEMAESIISIIINNDNDARLQRIDRVDKSIYDKVSYKETDITFKIIDIIRSANGNTKIIAESNPGDLKIDITIPNIRSNDNALIRDLLLKKYYILTGPTKSGLKIGSII